jgi:hypothetical protein
LGAAVERGPESRAGLVVSILLHAAIIGATLFAFSQARLDIADEAPPVVPVDLVTIAKKTNIAPTVKFEPKKAEETVELKKVETLTPPKLPPLEQQAEVAPPEQPKAEPLFKPEAPPIVPKARPRQETKPPKKAANQDFAALLNKLTSPAAAPKNAKVAEQTIKGAGAQNAMTMDLVDALRNQIRPCWSPQVGAPRAEELIIDIDLFLNPDGSVARPPQLTASSQARVRSDPYTSAAAAAALRAIYECAPYKLPQDRYAQWREINPFHFDPSKMMDQ